MSEWLDLERNAAILEKTDKAIADKLRTRISAATAGAFSSDLRVKSAAQVLSLQLPLHLLLTFMLHIQVLLEAGDSISDSDIDSLLGLGGVDDGLADEVKYAIFQFLLLY